MIVLTVVSYNGAPSDGRSALFDELGGTIGRADTNQLVLPDPERSISRVHAQVLYRNGQYALKDQGSNAVLVNGQPLGHGKEVPVRDGDELQIGGYLLRVSIGQKTQAPADPFADLFGDPKPAPAPGKAGLFDPPAVQTARAPAMPTPMGDPGKAAGGIPDDWDPFGAKPVQPAFSAPAAGGVASSSSLMAPEQEQSLDDLFGLAGGASSTGETSDPFQPSPHGTGAAMKQVHDDLFDGLLGPAAAGEQATPDHASELQTPWMAPPLGAASPPAAPPPPIATPAPPAPPTPQPALPAGAVFSWDQPGGPTPTGVTQIIGKPRPAAAATQSQGTAAFAPPPAPPQAAAPAGSNADANELLVALRQGLGMPDLPLQQLGPAEMRLIGALLKEATQGTVDLLVARNALKREMRAEVTVIAVRENNPLKFSPSAEVAVQYLLGPARPGFMAPAAAMHDAFVDLRAHQMAVMAGMRSALAGLLQRFDPAVLEQRIERKSPLAAVLPSGRKAKLWEQFQALYQQLSQESSEDFERLFGQAFVQAYEACLDDLSSSQGG